MMGKYTSGPAEVSKTLTSLYVVGGPTKYGRPTICDMPTFSNGAPCEGAAGDAALIAEAFNVAHETGLTPRQLAEQRERLLAALAKIEKWFGEFPPTGRTWENSNGTPSDRPMSYAACYGSNGERDFMRGIARAAIADAEGATP